MLKTYTVYRNGAMRGSIVASSLGEAEDEAFELYGEQLVVEEDNSLSTQEEIDLLNQIDSDFYHSNIDIEDYE